MLVEHFPLFLDVQVERLDVLVISISAGTPKLEELMKIPHILKRNVRVDIDFCSQTAWVRIPLRCRLAVRSWATHLAFLCLGAHICKTGRSSGPVHRIAVKMKGVTYAKRLARRLAPVTHSRGFVSSLLLFYGTRQARSVFFSLYHPLQPICMS